MRELKFRAWGAFKPHFGNPILEMSYDALVMNGSAYTYDQEFGAALSDSPRLKKVDCELMQFTGLKDKSGVDVFEGDIVLVREARICEVVFHEQAGCWDLIPRNILSSESIGAVSPASYKYHTEVIGNIHQHPELLGVSHDS